MRVSALRITRPQAPPPPDLWEDFEDIRDDTLRHGRLYTDTTTSPKALNDYNIDYQLQVEAYQKQRLKEQQAKNKARALAEYEWRKPENVAARLAKAKAERLAKEIAEEAARRALMEQLAASEITQLVREHEEATGAALSKTQRRAEWELRQAERKAAIAWWTEMNKSYATEFYEPCRFDRPMRVGTVELEANKGYWLPGTVRLYLFKQLGLC